MKEDPPGPRGGGGGSLEGWAQAPFPHPGRASGTADQAAGPFPVPTRPLEPTSSPGSVPGPGPESHGHATAGGLTLPWGPGEGVPQAPACRVEVTGLFSGAGPRGRTCPVPCALPAQPSPTGPAPGGTHGAPAQRWVMVPTEAWLGDGWGTRGPLRPEGHGPCWDTEDPGPESPQLCCVPGGGGPCQSGARPRWCSVGRSCWPWALGSGCRAWGLGAGSWCGVAWPPPWESRNRVQLGGRAWE